LDLALTEDLQAANLHVARHFVRHVIPFPGKRILVQALGVAAQVDLDHPGVVLHILHRTLAQELVHVQHANGAGKVMNAKARIVEAVEIKEY
jgi:hypothetical protein